MQRIFSSCLIRITKQNKTKQNKIIVYILTMIRIDFIHCLVDVLVAQRLSEKKMVLICKLLSNSFNLLSLSTHITNTFIVPVLRGKLFST